MTEDKDKIIVVAPKEEKEENQKDRYLEDGDGFDAEDLQWIQQKEEKIELSRALARELLRRRNCMRIVQLMLKKRVALRQKEIVVSLKLNWKLGQHNLDQLIKVGVVKNVPVTVLDKQSKYYR